MAVREPTVRRRVIAAGTTDVGLQREHNEDSYLLLVEHDLFIVADCDPVSCFAASFNAGTTPDVIFTCLGPGTYRVVVDSRTTANVPYELGLTSCNSCLPVPSLPISWSGVKARLE